MPKQIDVSDLPDALVQALETIVRTYREQAALRSPASEPQRPIGWLKGKFEIPDSFFDPLPDDLLDLFQGKADT